MVLNLEHSRAVQSHRGGFTQSTLKTGNVDNENSAYSRRAPGCKKQREYRWRALNKESTAVDRGSSNTYSSCLYL